MQRTVESRNECEHKNGLLDIYDLHWVLDEAKSLKIRRMAVVYPYDVASLRSSMRAMREGIVEPILIGEESKIKRSAEEHGVSVQGIELIHTKEEMILERACELYTEGRAHFIMKGMVGTGFFFHTLLDPRFGIRTERILSHVGMFEIPQTERIFLMSDAAINILPNFSRKIHIIANAVDAARRLKIGSVRVAMLAAVEKVNLPAMPATLDAFLMKKYAQTGYFGRCSIDGPFAFDNAVDPDCAGTKGIGGEVAGRANVVIVPNIETGNVIWKSITCLQKKEAAGVVLGGSCPIVVPSRSDDHRTKLASIKLARLLMD
jgi:phosphate butyryltransferase